MSNASPFKWRHFEAEIILLCVRWYLRYSLSYRDLEEMMAERGLSIDHTTIYRWVQRYAPELDKRCRPQLKACNDSWRVDETYMKIKKTQQQRVEVMGARSWQIAFRIYPTGPRGRIKERASPLFNLPMPGHGICWRWGVDMCAASAVEVECESTDGWKIRCTPD